ncbi:hypothetical protein MSG28_009069 [Choristoneura fumiferana]|uniref:Uncharacterized protein n=1 Tax=Choristoneura fumiferana TaxID=7141 RepID=A0ACC0KWJ7_CHOFU|nr:hypothetical protein MSG28_009069 [Choristoneura fumiferana]
MARLVLLCMTICILQANSYVLLTANVEDVHSIAQQIAQSPVVDQVKSIWRRAKNSFNESYEKNGQKMRADDSGNEKVDSKEDVKIREERRKAVEELLDMGRNATVYIKTIKDIVDRI